MDPTAQIIVAIGTAAGVVIGAVASLIGALMGIRNSGKLNEVHKLTNSLADRSNTAERAAGMAEGELKGRDHTAAVAAAAAPGPPVEPSTVVTAPVMVIAPKT